ncbi:MAG: hypothetical protein H0X70_08365 [Segetibacter sp.]|nr:hypothetical protein [Segetibacter sp.]
MKTISLIAFAAVIILTACKTEVKKKVMILGKGDISAEGGNITLKGSSGSSDKTIDLGDETALQVTSPAGKNSITVPNEDGFYILNLRTDTIVGSQQNLGSDLGGRTITQEELKVKIDSLTQLTTGANVKAGRSYLILPNQLIKITDNKGAKVFGPFTKIPGSLDADEKGKAPELYKFYTNTEMRELIANLKKMTI